MLSPRDVELMTLAQVYHIMDLGESEDGLLKFDTMAEYIEYQASHGESISRR